MIDTTFVRKQFPALKNDFVFMDNAGGSQVLGNVINRISDYFTNHNVQLGASYEVSAEAGKSLKLATHKIANLLNATRDEEIVIGSSTTMLLRILSVTISKQWVNGDEVIVTNTDHEANISPWTALNDRGINVKIWKVNKDSLKLEISDLKNLMNKRTKLVAVTHASNVLGSINPIKEIAREVHNAGALICVDGVAFAPHRQVDVKELEVDFYTFSWYKTYGPHLAVMFGNMEQLEKLDSLNHYFIGKDVVPYKLQPGNFNFELTYSTLGIMDYYEELYDHHYDSQKVDFQEKIQKSFELISAHEEALATLLLNYLNTIPEIQIIGHTNADASLRVPTISFIHSVLKSDEIVEQMDKHRIGIRFGDFYAKKLIETLHLEPKNGVVRVSLVHYNTIEEVEKLIAVFQTIF